MSHGRYIDWSGECPRDDPLDGEPAARLLTAQGLTAVRRIQLPPGAPGLTVGLR